jgi:hypothetical protein
MKALAFATCVAITFLVAGTPAQADFRIIQWYFGDCKIWGGDRPPIWGGWRALSRPTPHYGNARYELQRFYDRGVCY